MRREPIDRAVLAALVSRTGKNGGLDEMPEDKTLPYFIVYALPSGAAEDQWEDPENFRDLLYQVTSVGSDRRQASWMADRVFAAMVGRLTGGDYQQEITPDDGAQVIWRKTDGIGAPEATGPELWQRVDTYRLRAQK